MKILVFNHSFFNISETFIYKQVTGMPQGIDLSLMGFSYLNEQAFPLTNRMFKVSRAVGATDRILTNLLNRLFGLRLGFSLVNYLRVKRLLTRHRFDLIHAHFGFNAIAIYPVAKALNIPMVVTFHGVDASPEYLDKKSYGEEVQKLIAYARSIIIVSPHMMDTLQLHRYKEKVHLIPCCVNPAEFLRPVSTVQSSAVRILHSGRLISKKGVPDLIRVCVSLSLRYPHVKIDIIGDGPELDLSKALAASAGTEAINFYGARSHGEVRSFMAASDIFVLNSRTGDTGDMEGLPVSVLEAMSMGLAVVSTNHAGIPLAITDGKEGLLVNEKDNEALENALEKLILDKDLRNKLGKAAREKVKEQFTIEKMNRRILEVYKGTFSAQLFHRPGVRY